MIGKFNIDYPWDKVAISSSIEPVVSSLDYSISPNPSFGYFSISITNDKFIYAYQIYDVNGHQLFYKHEFSSNEIQIDL